MLKSWTQTGMSLVEVMIGGAMLAGVALVGAELFKQQSSATKDVVVRAELDAYHNKITTIMSDARNCTATLSVSIGSTSVYPQNFLARCCTNASTNPNCTLTQDSCVPGIANWGTDRDLFVMTNQWGTTPPSGASGFTLRDLRLINSDESASVSAPVGNGVIKAILQVEYRLLRPYLTSGSISAGIVKRKIPLNLKFTASGGFRGCVDGESGSKNTLQQELCRTLGPSLTTYNPETDKCEYKDTAPTHSCPLLTGDPRSILVGLNSNGDPVCRSGVDAFNENDVINSTNASGCAAGASVGFYYDSATNTIRVQCL